MRWIFTIAAVFLLVTGAPAEAQTDAVRVATRIIKPFVFEENGQLTGFSIELWTEISREIEKRPTYIVKPTLAELLNATRSGEAEVGIAAISITEERERTSDFSLPMFDSGLQIMVPAQGGGGSPLAILSALAGPEFLPVLFVMIVGTLLAGHVIWFFERNREHDLVTRRSYFPGIFEAIFWSTTALGTQAEAWPKSAVSRIVSVFWMFSSIIFIAVFTAYVTTALTVQQLKSDIQGPEDLPGKQVATVQSSTAAAYLASRNIGTLNFPTVDEAIRAVENGEADAVVFDAPVLQYYASHDGKGKVGMAGAVFRRESYGIQFPSGSPLRKPVNEALLRLRENGTYERLLTKWFGGEGGKSST